MNQIWNVFAVGALCLLAGCGNDNAEVYPVTGTVTFKGKPMPLGGSIAFVPAEGQYGPAAGGTIDENGQFVLSTYEDGDGAVAGKHRVVISQVTELEPGMEDVGKDGEKSSRKVATTSVPQSEWIPQVYADHRNSPLTATVEPKENSLTFDLMTE